MNEKKRRWQFGLRWVFVAVLTVAAFCAGRATEVRRAEQAVRQQAELEQQLAQLMGYGLYTDEFAVQVQRRAERLIADGAVSRTNPLPRDELFAKLNVEAARLPKTNWADNDEHCWLLSPHYVLSFNSGPDIHAVRVTEQHRNQFPSLMQYYLWDVYGTHPHTRARPGY